MVDDSILNENLMTRKVAVSHIDINSARSQSE
jgi:hypothetical protein